MAKDFENFKGVYFGEKLRRAKETKQLLETARENWQTFLKSLPRNMVESEELAEVSANLRELYKRHSADLEVYVTFIEKMGYDND